MPVVAAVDLGATSGRVVNVLVEPDRIELDEVHRFANTPRPAPHGDLVWDIDVLDAQVRAGLRAAAERAPLTSVAIDSWAVDYGLLDRRGERLGPVHAYRSTRTHGVMDATVERVGAGRIYAATGIQFLPFNTAFQLIAASSTTEYAAAAGLLMVPDLLNHGLCASTTNDVSNASTTQLLDAATHRWHDGLVAEFGLRRDLLPELHQPGASLGRVRGVGAGVDGVEVIAAASHDTASAVAGTPLAKGRPAVYISCGTWALVGCELDAPVTGPEALAENVTNELGVGGTTRLLKNVTGLWLLERAREVWRERGMSVDIAELVTAARQLPGGRSVIDPDDVRLQAAGAVTEQIAVICRATGQPVPETPAEVTRTILDSLALAWRATVATIERLGGFRAEVVHLVGGGAANVLLAELCASACERPVLAGPIEATVVGNALVQAIAAGVVTDLAAGRALVERSLPPVHIEPRHVLDWDALANRLAATRPTHTSRS